MRIIVPKLRSVLTGVAAFAAGVGLFAGAHIFAQTNTVQGPLGAVYSQTDPNPPICQAGYYPQQFVYQINSGSISSDISTDSSTWYECVPPQYLNPAPCMIYTTGSDKTGLYDHVTYKYANAVVSARLLEYPNEGTGKDPTQDPNQPIDVQNLATPNGNSGYGYPDMQVGESHEVILEVKNAAGQVNTCGTTVYRNQGTLENLQA